MSYFGWAVLGLILLTVILLIPGGDVEGPAPKRPVPFKNSNDVDSSLR
jgi:hypothetical protein